MQKRGLILLATATLVLVALALVAVATGDRTVSHAAPGEAALPGLAGKLGEAASVVVKRSGLELTFVRDGDGWLVVEKGNYPAAGKVRQIVLGMADLALVEPKTQKPEFYPRLEVEDAMFVTLQKNYIPLPDSFYTVNKNFKPKHLPQSKEKKN